MIYEKGPDRGPSHINRYWLVLAPTLWPVFKPALTCRQAASLAENPSMH